MQNLPSKGNVYASIVKECIVTTEGFLTVAADEAQLEDRILTSLTGCVNKVKIYKDHVDAHCLNASVYFKEELEERGITYDINDVASINHIEEVAPDLRQDGKPCTYAIT